MIDTRMSPAADESPPLFGAFFGGVPVVLPEGIPVAYLTEAAIHPLPGAPRRVMGLMQLQGHPVVVLDPGAQPLTGAAALRRQAVLVFGAAPASAALRMDEAPMPIAVGAPVADCRPPDCAFAAVLTMPMTDARDASRIWWRFSTEALCRALACDTEPSA